MLLACPNIIWKWFDGLNMSSANVDQIWHRRTGMSQSFMFVHQNYWNILFHFGDRRKWFAIFCIIWWSKSCRHCLWNHFNELHYLLNGWNTSRLKHLAPADDKTSALSHRIWTDINCELVLRMSCCRYSSRPNVARVTMALGVLLRGQRNPKFRKCL